MWKAHANNADAGAWVKYWKKSTVCGAQIGEAPQFCAIVVAVYVIIPNDHKKWSMY